MITPHAASLKRTRTRLPVFKVKYKSLMSDRYMIQLHYVLNVIILDVRN